MAGKLLLLSACVLGTNLAQAHLSYTGRNFGAFTGLSPASVSINNQTVTGNYGWADAADGILGDSHRGRAFRFHLDNTATILFSVSANATATQTSLGGLLPGFTLYSGLGAIAPFAPTQTALASSADHDSSDSSVAWRTAWAQFNLGETFDATSTDGSWNALGNWKIGGDGDLPGDFSQLSSFTFQGFAVDTDMDGSVEGSFQLAAGDYTIFVGGNDIANKNSDTALAGFGLATTLTITPIPEPSTYALLAMSAGVLGWVARRRAKNV